MIYRRHIALAVNINPCFPSDHWVKQRKSTCNAIDVRCVRDFQHAVRRDRTIHGGSRTVRDTPRNPSDAITIVIEIVRYKT